MTIVDHTVELGSPTGGAGTGAREYNATLFVESDDPADTGHAILNYVIQNGYNYGVQWAFGNDHNDRVRLYQIDPPQYMANSAYKWRVPLRYKEMKALQAYASQPTIDPAKLQPKITVRNSGRGEIVKRGTYRGGLNTGWTVDEERLITNSAEVEFTEPIEKQSWNKTIRIVRRTAAVLFNDVAFPTDWINDRDFTIYNDFISVPIKQYELKFGGWEVDAEQYEGMDLVRVEFIGEIKPGGWRIELLDKGFSVAACADEGRPDGRGGYISSAEPDPPGVAKKREILDRNGMAVTEPQPLDGEGNIIEECPVANYFYGEWSIHDEIDPTSLGFFAGISAVPAE